METNKSSGYHIFDAEGRILGRVASESAKRLLSGEKVVILNSEKAVITGRKKQTVKKYFVRVGLTEKANPDHSPYWSKRPDLLVKRVVRGMLPYRKPSGKNAYRNLRVFMGTPEEFKGKVNAESKSKNLKLMYSGYMTVKELSSLLGYTV